MTKVYISKEDHEIEVDGKHYLVTFEYTFYYEKYIGSYFNEPTTDVTDKKVKVVEVKQDNEVDDYVTIVPTFSLLEKIKDAIEAELTFEAIEND